MKPNQADREAADELPDINEQAIGVLCYKNNSVSWWWSKAVNYKAALGRAWDALRSNGVLADGKTDVAAGIEILAAERFRAGMELARAEAAKVAGGWKSSLRPGSAVRLSGHHEAARDISAAILAIDLDALGEK